MARISEDLSVGLEHHQISGSLTDLSVEIGSLEAGMFSHERFPDPAIVRFLTEELFASSLSICRTLLGNSFRPLRIELSYPAPPWAQEYRRLFGCPIHFESAHNATFWESQWLSRPIPSHNSTALAEALRLCRAETESSGQRGDLSISIELWIRGKLDSCPTAAQAAKQFNLTERTLRRHLASLGTSFQEIHDRVRAARAETLLRTKGLGTAEIAAQLGFSDAREFRRAFKRWTGRAPRAEPN